MKACLIKWSRNTSSIILRCHYHLQVLNQPIYGLTFFQRRINAKVVSTYLQKIKSKSVAKAVAYHKLLPDAKDKIRHIHYWIQRLRIWRNTSGTGRRSRNSQDCRSFYFIKVKVCWADFMGVSALQLFDRPVHVDGQARPLQTSYISVMMRSMTESFQQIRMTVPSVVLQCIGKASLESQAPSCVETYLAQYRMTI